MKHLTKITHVTVITSSTVQVYSPFASSCTIQSYFGECVANKNKIAVLQCYASNCCHRLVLVNGNFYDAFHFKWPIKLGQLDAGFKHLKVVTFEISTRLNGEFDNLSSPPTQFSLLSATAYGVIT